MAETHTQLIRRARRPKDQKIRGELEQKIREQIKLDWSPEQIAGRRKHSGKERISFQAIYRFIERDRLKGGNLSEHLRILRRYRKDKKPPYKPTRLKDRVMIDQRPEIVEKRERLGDWERDSVLGIRLGSSLLTIVDRTSRLGRLGWMSETSSHEVHDETVRLLRDEVIHSMTNDNGTEFSQHRKTAEKLNTMVYFSHSYRSWERGSNENFNGLVRQYFPRGKDIGKPTRYHLRLIAHRLNSRPRKCLGFQTPLEVHKKLKSSVLR
jgi:IS30 family transposase